MPLKSPFKLYFLLTFLSTIFCYAQNPVYFKIGEQEFANTEVYTVLYDDFNDIIYAGTNNGLYAYKQNHFIQIKQAKNQKGNSVFSLKQNAKGEVFCNNLNGQVLKISANHLELVYQTKEKSKSSYFWYYFIEENQLLIVTNSSIKKIALSSNEEITLFHGKNSIRHSNKTSFGVFFHINLEKESYILNYKDKKLTRLRNTTSKEIDLIDNFIVQKNTFYAKGKFGKFIGLNNTPLIINFKPQLKEKFFSINSDIVLALSVQKGARYIYLENNKLTASESFLNNMFLSAFAVSKSGTILFGTFNDGLVIVPNYKVTKTTKIGELFLGITTNPNNTIGLSTRSGTIYSYKNSILNQIDKVPHNVDDIYYFDKTNTNSQSNNHFIYNKINSPFIGTKDIIAITPDIFLISSQLGLTIKNFNPNHPIKKLAYLSKKANIYSLIPKERTNALAWNKKDSIIYYNTHNGLYKKNWSELKSNLIIINNKPLFANDITMIGNNLLCGTSNGIIILNNEKPIFKLHKKDGLLGNSVKKVVFRDSMLYILVKKGIQLYDMRKKQFLGFGTKEGVVAQNIKNFAISKDKLWLLEKNSFSSVPLNSLTNKKNNHVSKLYIDSILVNNERINFLKQNKFTYTKNQLIFYVDYRNLET